MMFFYYLSFFIQAPVGFYLVFPLLLYVIYSVRHRFIAAPPAGPAHEADYAVIVTAYQQADQLPDVVRSLLSLSYTRYHIYVVADNCDLSGIHIGHPKVLVLRPPTVLGGNVRSHFYAIGHFIRNHERLVIIDSDNLADPDLLNHFNSYFDRGFEAVQGLRQPKNLDTPIARLDAARDIYYHFYDGKVLFGAGSSATLSGSGMAFSVPLYRQCLEQRAPDGAGFDKVLQSALVSLDIRIAFAPEAIVLDEKTTAPGQLVGQRARWINTWFRYFRYGFVLIGKSIRTGSWNQFLFGLVLLRPPLFIFMLLAVVFMLANLAISPVLSFSWLAGLLLFIGGFFLALSRSETPPVVYRALWGIPRFMFYQLLALLKVRKANTYSVATSHGQAAGKKAPINPKTDPE